MHVTIVHVSVRPESVEAFIAATQANHEQSILEPGNLRFDVLQNPEDATKFILYEAYVDADEAAAHKETAHYLIWRQTVEEMMAKPRKGLPFHGLFPTV